MDRALFLAINQGLPHPWLLDAIMGWVSQKWTFSYPLLVIILVLLWRGAGIQGVKVWLLAVLLIVVGDTSGNLLKKTFSLPRPCRELGSAVRLVEEPFKIGCSPTPTGMPSNHAINFVLSTTFLCLILKSRHWTLGLGAISLLVMLSRVYLGVHYPSQVLAGGAWGLILALAFFRLSRRILPFVRDFRWRPRSAAAGHGPT